MLGIDGMRYLGTNPAEPADDIERVVMRALARRVIQEEKRAARG